MRIHLRFYDSPFKSKYTTSLNRQLRLCDFATLYTSYKIMDEGSVERFFDILKNILDDSDTKHYLYTKFIEKRSSNSVTPVSAPAPEPVPPPQRESCSSNKKRKRTESSSPSSYTSRIVQIEYTCDDHRDLCCVKLVRDTLK